MDDHKELVARLRALHHEWAFLPGKEVPRGTTSVRQAADAIERLTKDRDEARAALKRLSS